MTLFSAPTTANHARSLFTAAPKTYSFPKKPGERRNSHQGEHENSHRDSQEWRAPVQPAIVLQIETARPIVYLDDDKKRTQIHEQVGDQVNQIQTASP